VVKNLTHHQSDHINKYVYKNLLNLLKDKPYIKTFDDEYNYYDVYASAHIYADVHLEIVCVRAL
jgi:hypothetical protein